jgi:hypothetical protein
MPMRRGLTDTQIEFVARQLIATSYRVTVRDVMQALRARFGGSGRTERVCHILQRIESERPARVESPPGTEDVEQLRERVRRAEARAALSEERERQHQDLWARRYAEKVAELERQQLRASQRSAGVPHDQYLRIHVRAAELARRLARYEDPDQPLAPVPPTAAPSDQEP